MQWCETFASWLTEAKWSKSGYIPSTDEYLRTATISIAAHTLVLPASFFVKSSSPNAEINPTAADYKTITKLTMLIPRLLNDIQSYQVNCKTPSIITLPSFHLKPLCIHKEANCDRRK